MEKTDEHTHDISIALSSVHATIQDPIFILRKALLVIVKLNIPRYDTIHVTIVETNIECDTSIPLIGTSIFHPYR